MPKATLGNTHATRATLSPLLLINKSDPIIDLTFSLEIVNLTHLRFHVDHHKTIKVVGFPLIFPGDDSGIFYHTVYPCRSIQIG